MRSTLKESRSVKLPCYNKIFCLLTVARGYTENMIKGTCTYCIMPPSPRRLCMRRVMAYLILTGDYTRTPRRALRLAAKRCFDSGTSHNSMRPLLMFTCSIVMG